MSDTPHFGFGKFVPGFDFLQSLAKGASSSIPQLPNLSNWVAPTLSVEELEKRIGELKAVQFWLEQNSRALTATIQALEVQKMTLATLKGMNFSMADVANAFQLRTADAMMGAAHKAADAAGTAEAARQAARTAAPAHAAPPPEREAAQPASAAGAQEPPNDSAGKASDAGASPMVDPMQWWGALTSQFQQIASNAMKDAAAHAALDTTKNMAADLAKEALKTATSMASQFAAPGAQATPAGASRASAAKKKPAAKAAKPAARKAPAPARAAAKKTPARRAPRKPAG